MLHYIRLKSYESINFALHYFKDFMCHVRLHQAFFY